MKHILLVDSNRDFLNDASTRVMISYEDIALDDVTSTEDIARKVSGKEKFLIAVSDRLIDEITPELAKAFPKHFVCGYCSDPANVKVFLELGVPCLGVVQLTDDLLEKVRVDKVQVYLPKPKKKPAPQPVVQEQPMYQSVNPATSVSSAPVTQVNAEVLRPVTSPQVTYGQNPQPPQSYETLIEPLQPIQPEQVAQPQQPVPPQQPQPAGYISQEQMMAMFQQFMTMQQGVQPAQPAQSVVAPPPISEPVSAVTQIEELHQENEKNFAEQALQEDLKVQAKKPAAVISVYSAKGGVGKTTLSSEIAVCLAMTSTGRRKLKVCVVDYNIDFGDVITTLAFGKDSLATSADWATEIKYRLGLGEAPESIQYTENEIKSDFLRTCKYGRAGNQIEVYGLIAPATHEDSMDIGEDELAIMLDNLINNGGFDYIICDTGNNTRDSSVVALQRAKHVLLVCNQDISTANCNNSFLDTMRKIDFNLGKVRIVVNNVVPSREARISVAEVQDAFSDYPCVGCVNRTMDVVAANNQGIPLVFDPDHEYTKQIRQITKFITDGERFVDEYTEPEKKKGFFFRKKRQKITR